MFKSFSDATIDFLGAAKRAPVVPGASGISRHARPPYEGAGCGRDGGARAGVPPTGSGTCTWRASTATRARQRAVQGESLVHTAVRQGGPEIPAFYTPHSWRHLKSRWLPPVDADPLPLTALADNATRRTPRLTGQDYARAALVHLRPWCRRCRPLEADACFSPRWRTSLCRVRCCCRTTTISGAGRMRCAAFDGHCETSQMKSGPPVTRRRGHRPRRVLPTAQR